MAAAGTAPAPAAARTLAFEIGTEEIPAFDLAKATAQLEGLVAERFAAQRFKHGSIEVMSTPRRLIVMVNSLEPLTDALTEEHKGPAAAIAFDSEGRPTKAALGFARGKGLDVAQLERRQVDGTEYLFAVKRIPAREVGSLLPEVLAGVIEGISWPKSCRWGTQTAFFSRPVRWLLALWGTEAIPVRFASLEASGQTCGHRFLAPGPHRVASADDLIATLEAAFVVPRAEQRERIIREGIAALEEGLGAQAELPAKTLTEVVNLTEYPTPMVGTFEEDFLRVPEEIIVDAMLMHQRYFPLYDKQHALTNHFIIVSNGDPANTAVIKDGNERVVRPRLSDAKFFYEEDLKHPLASYVERLDEVVFQEALGTMKAKTMRMVALVDALAQAAGLTPQDIEDAKRAAYLCKADLVSNAVVEFTSVQGIMGSYYAQASGENVRVAQAIADHYRPRFAGDEPPRSVVGQLVAMADKLDTIAGLFALGQGPTGSSDPFALRRGALGIIAMLTGGLPVSLVDALDLALDAFVAVLPFERAAVREEVIAFFITRTRVKLADEGCPADVIDAVLAVGVSEPVPIIARALALIAARLEMPQDFDDLATAFARANNLASAALGTTLDETLMGEAEIGLYRTIQEVDAQVKEALGRNDHPQAF
ncbi:MAG: glycine--tRNA ligase subunit beta, partial [Coriobacteriaceae bacterium]|nr:glycine--tRNA ligase subunit beta [Coriobacteriaceae bacterium]